MEKGILEPNTPGKLYSQARAMSNSVRAIISTIILVSAVDFI